MDRSECIARFGPSAFAVLATHGPHGRLDLVPCCFALLDPDSATDTDPVRLVTAVDHKPKRHQRLARLDNVVEREQVSLLVDERSDDWSQLWWVRVEGTARVVEAGPDHVEAVNALVAKYTQYQEHRPAGPAIIVDAVRWRGWSAA